MTFVALYVFPFQVRILNPIEETKLTRKRSNGLTKTTSPFSPNPVATGFMLPSKLSKSGVMINLNAISSITFDKENHTATLGGGILTGDVPNAAHANGVHIMTGVCNKVGLIPAYIGGGLGNLMGLCGLGVDNTVEAILLTASGEKVTVSKNENSELWWGLRGAGGNFGVVSRLTVKSYEL